MARPFPKLDGAPGFADFWEHLRNLIAVDRQLRRGRFPSGSDLAAQLGVHLRTVHRYLDFLRSLGAPLEYREPEKGFAYSRPWNFAKELFKAARQEAKGSTRQRSRQV